MRSGGTTTRPCLSASVIVTPVKTKRFILRASGVSESSAAIRSTLWYQLARGKTSTFLSMPRSRTSSPPSPSRNFAGRVRRFFSSIVCSWVP